MFAFITKLISLLITQPCYKYFFQHLSNLFLNLFSKHLSQESPSLWKMFLSVLAAVFGVQSEQNRQRDFSKGNAWTFAFLGLIALIIFIIGVILLTRWALSLAGV